MCLAWSVENSVIQVSFDNTDVGPPMYGPGELRLDIYAATWGCQDYTDFVRQQYISNTIGNPPTDTSNTWTLTASLNNFGADPDYKVQKSCTIIYRMAYRIGQTNGKISSPSDPSPSDQNYDGNNVRTVFTDQYPVLFDVSKFHIAAATENGVIVINLLEQDMTPMVWPQPLVLNQTTLYKPLVVAAVWATTDVTNYVQNAIATEWANGGASDTTVPVSVSGMGGGIQPG